MSTPPITPEAALDVIERVGRTLPGFRRAHARGLGVHAHFRAAPDAAKLTRAAHFSGEEIPCIVRFSNASANPCTADMNSPKEGTVLGLAVRFLLPSGEAATWAGINLSSFVARTPDEFIALTESQTPNAKGKPNPLRLAWHVLTHLHILPGIKAVTSLKPTPTFARETYFGLHTYFFVDAAGKRQPFRYRWIPREKAPTLTAEDARSKPAHHLLDEMRTRLAKGEVIFDLVAQLPDAGDELLQANVQWPETRRTVPLGTLTLTRIHEDQSAVEGLVFDPGGVVPGIETSDDPILKFRSRIYGASYDRRSKETRTEKGPSDLGQ